MSLFSRFKPKRPFCAAVVVAAGNATRMQGIDKVLAELSGRPMIAHTLDALEACSLIDEIIVVTREDLILPVGTICRQNGYTKVKKLVIGGEDRSHSVQNGLREVSEDADLIAIHDGARPFVDQAVLQEVIETAAKTNAAAPAIPVTDTVKTAQDGIVTGTPDRSTLFAVQTPQVFDADLIRGALYHCIEKGLPLTDDCSAVEQLGKKVVLTQGSVENIKITTQFDLLMGEAILACRTLD